MPWHVVFHRKAQRDAREAMQWFKLQGSRAERHWHRELTELIHRLERNPYQFAEAEGFLDVGLPLREAILGRKSRNVNRVLFVIEESRVIIYRMRHASMDLPTPDDF